MPSFFASNWMRLLDPPPETPLASRDWEEAFRSLIEDIEQRESFLDMQQVRSLMQSFVRWAVETRSQNGGLTPGLRDVLEQLYHTSRSNSEVRPLALVALAQAGGVQDVESLTDLLLASPPDSAVAAAGALLALAKNPEALRAAFPRLLEGLSQPSLAAAILDLANYATRRGWFSEHPARHRSADLRNLLIGVTHHLREFQEAPPGPEDIRPGPVAEGICLTIALCDCLAWIGDPDSIGPLWQVAELRHRRLRVEALHALCRLGQAEAADPFLALASEASVRLRVLAYAQELDWEDRVPEEYQTPLARAEAELVTWLSEPTQMGVAPERCELLDSRTLYWPGFEEPRMCFLFRYAYVIDQNGRTRELSGIGLAGPVCMAFRADLADLPVTDIYAMFAGWHVEHPEIVDVVLPTEDSRLASLVEPLRVRLEQNECEQIEPLVLSKFFGENALVARARRRAQPGIAWVEHDQFYWYPTAGLQRPLDAEHIIYLHRGRKLLRSFNDEWN